MKSREAASRALVERALEIYDQKTIAAALGDSWSREKVNRWLKGKILIELNSAERHAIESMLPRPSSKEHSFDFIDLFAGIGGLRRSFESVGGRCVFTSEWNKQALRTYKANYHSDPHSHTFCSDIRDVTLSRDSRVSSKAAYKHIDKVVPDHDVLLAGFPCQPFSIAGVSKKNSLGRAHGFECNAQGTLFFDVARILAAKRPAAFLLENVKNLKNHDGGRTFQVIIETLNELGYWVADQLHSAGCDPKIVDGQMFVPQHRERMVLVGFRRDLEIHEGFSLAALSKMKPRRKPTLGDILEPEVDPKYILTEKLWEYLFNYAIRHKKKGNGFGYGLVNEFSVTRTLSARYYKDGSEILIDRGFDFSKAINHPRNMRLRPRRLTPRECARLMGYDKPGRSDFKIPVSDTQAYKQFGNSVVVPVFSAIAHLMLPHLLAAKAGGAASAALKSPRIRKRA